MFLRLVGALFVRVQLYTTRVSCAVPLRIVTVPATGELTPSQPAVLNIIPDETPLISGRRQRTLHPVTKTIDPLKAARKLNPSEESLEFPNAYDYEGYYYDKDYYKYYKSYYVDNGDVGFQFKHPRYPYGHTLFAQALLLKQVPHVFKEVFFPTAVKVRASSINVGEFYTQAVPLEIFKYKRPHGIYSRRSLNQESTLKPQTPHPIRKSHSGENINSMNFKSILSYYTYKEERIDRSKYSTSKINIYNDDKSKSSDKKNFESMLSYVYNEEGKDASKDGSNKKRPNPEIQPGLRHLRRQLEPVKSTLSSWHAARRTPRPKLKRSQNPPVDPWDFVPQKLASNSRRLADTIHANDDKIPESELKAPFELHLESAAEMAIAPAILYFHKLLAG